MTEKSCRVHNLRFPVMSDLARRLAHVGSSRKSPCPPAHAWRRRRWRSGNRRSSPSTEGQAVALGDLRGQRKMRRRRLLGRRNAHQAGDRQAILVAAGGEKAVGTSAGSTPAFCGFLAGIDLDEEQQACAPAGRSPCRAPRPGSPGRPSGWRRTAPPPRAPCSIAACR